MLPQRTAAAGGGTTAASCSGGGCSMEDEKGNGNIARGQKAAPQPAQAAIESVEGCAIWWGESAVGERLAQVEAGVQ